MKENQDADCLRLLDDGVLNLENGKDAFNHEVYAKILAKIFRSDSGNRYGMSVALFGKWGQGKSSVVEMLKHELKGEKIEVVLFNAWQARGDSVRRQLFLEVLSLINLAEAKKMKRFAGLEVTRELLQTEEDRFESKKNARRNLRKSINDDKMLGWSFFALLVILVIPALSFGNYLSGVEISWANTLTQTIAFPLIFWIFKYIRENVVAKYTGLLGISEPISESQRLKYPEQFKDLFVKHTALYSRKSGRELLVVVDDLDRCEPETVVEALAAIRQLGGNQKYKPESGYEYQGEELSMKCRFLIPCDEKQVVLALETDGYFAGKDGARYHDYQSEELLRKFFDVVVRMDAFIPEDMVSYAGRIIEHLDGLSNQDVGLVQELVGAVAPRDPRQVKKLVNAYLVMKEKVRLAGITKRSRPENTLACCSKTLIFTIALQETVPDIYERLVDSSLSLDGLRQITENKGSQEEIRASRILRALEPVSEQTFRLLTRKGLPETLLNVNNGSEIYDSVLLGNEEVFENEIIKADNLDAVVMWLKEHRRAMHGTAQFRSALSCLIKPKEIPQKLLNGIVDYLQYPELKDALNGYNGVVRLAELGVEGKLGQGKDVLRQAIQENFCKLEDAKIFTSNELKSFLVLAETIPVSAGNPVVQRLMSLLAGEKYEGLIISPNDCSQMLYDLKKAIPDNYVGSVPMLAYVIATGCPWTIYVSTEEDRIRELHSSLIAKFIGNDANTAGKILDFLIGEKGPLSTATDLKKKGNSNAEREALRTVAMLMVKLPEAKIQKTYEKIREWITIQSDNSNFKVVCDSIQSTWTFLSEQQIDELAELFVKRGIVPTEDDWVYLFVGIGSREINAQNQRYAQLCQKIFSLVVNTQLVGTTINMATKKFLVGVVNNQWPVEPNADYFFADNLKSKIADQTAWAVWESAFWPLIEHHHSLTEKEVYEKIPKGSITDVLIPFAVEKLCTARKLTPSLKAALKAYFCSQPSAVNNDSFMNVFRSDDIDGTANVIEYIVDEVVSKKIQLDEPRASFIVEHIGQAIETTKQKFMDEFIRVNYLQQGDTAKFLLGVEYINSLDNPPQTVIQQVEEKARELNSILTDEEREVFTRILGEDYFDKIKKAEEATRENEAKGDSKSH